MDSNEGYLRSQFQAADKTSSGYLLPHEFGELLRQLNIDMTSKEIADVFDEVNTDRTEIEGTVYIFFNNRNQCSNVPTNPITITRIFPHWPMEQI